uniref:Protein kinase domain-containing protein n=1 Tax=Caenorhabditis japonica TaxID=281687 RepID=A0A8R1HS83_CAEJA
MFVYCKRAPQNAVDGFHILYTERLLKKSSKAGFSEKDREEMRREAQVVAALQNCENVVRLYGICEEAPFIGMIMEFCAGPNLSELVFQLNQLEIETETLRVFKWCHELTRALFHLNLTHYHGDVKPQNVLVKERPCCCRDAVYESVLVRDTSYILCNTCKGVHLEHLTLKICDFGNSNAHGTPRKYLGTLKYSAPETELGIYTEKSEVFSFGLLILTLVLGRPTEECTEEHGKFLKARNDTHFDLSKCNSNSISETITECTHSNPEHRLNFRQLLDKLNGRFDHYASLRGNDSRWKANREREEFMDQYKMIPRKITMAHRTTTTSTFLSVSTSNSSSNLHMDMDSGDVKYFGGPLENEVFVDSPYTSPPISRKNSDGYEKPRGYVENRIYTEDGWVFKRSK